MKAQKLRYGNIGQHYHNLITISAIKKKLEAAIYEGAGGKMYISEGVIAEIVSELTKEK